MVTFLLQVMEKSLYIWLVHSTQNKQTCDN